MSISRLPGRAASLILTLALLFSVCGVSLPKRPAVASTPASRLISTSRFLFGPDALSLDVQSFLDAQPGPLKSYTENVEGEQLTAAESVRLAGLRAGIHPGVILALLQAQTGAISSGAAPIPTRQGRGVPSLYAYAEWLADQLLAAYDGRRYGQVGDEVVFADGSRASAEADLPADYAVEAALAQVLPRERWEVWTQGPRPLFSATFAAWFGDPLSGPEAAPLTAQALPAGYSLPFTSGETWYYTGGPHHYCGWGYSNCTNPQPGGRPWSSIDIAPPEAVACPGGGYLDNRWIMPAREGTVVASSQGLVVIDHGDGWRTYYSHVATAGRRGTGPIGAGDAVGHPSCEVEPGGSTGGIHVHFAVWQAGSGFANIAGSALSGWVVGESTFYNGSMSRDGNMRYASMGARDGYNDLSNYSSQSASLNLTVKLENPQSLGNFSHSAQVAVVALKPGTNDIVFGPRVVTTNASGQYSGLSLGGLAPGTYDLCAKARQHLGQCARNIPVSAGGALSIDFSNGGSRAAWLGDIDLYGEDNQDNMLDWERVKSECRAHCGSAYLSMDLNRDGWFDSQDASLVAYRVSHDFRGEGYFGKPFPSAAQAVKAAGALGSLSLQPGFFEYLYVGNTYDQSIVLDTGGASVTGADTMLYYDPAVIEIVDEDAGAPDVQIKNAGLFSGVYRNRVDAAQGIIWFSAGNGNNINSFSGAGTLATFRFRVKTGTPAAGYSMIVPVVNANSSDESNGAQINTALDVLQTAWSNSFVVLDSPRPEPGITLSPSSASILAQSVIRVTAQVDEPYNQVQCVNFVLTPATGNQVSAEDCDGADGWSVDLDVRGLPDQAEMSLEAIVTLRASFGDYRAESTYLTLDRTPPSLHSVSLSPWVNQTVPVTIAVNENLERNLYVEFWANTASDSTDHGQWIMIGGSRVVRWVAGEPAVGYFDWDTTGWAAGPHALAINAWDDAGNEMNWSGWTFVHSPATYRRYLPIIQH